MPIFEYQCSKCDFVTEFLEKASRSGKHVCERCGGDMTKLFSGFSVGRSGCNTSQECPGCSNFECPHSN